MEEEKNICDADPQTILPLYKPIYPDYHLDFPYDLPVFYQLIETFRWDMWFNSLFYSLDRDDLERFVDKEVLVRHRYMKEMIPKKCKGSLFDKLFAAQEDFTKIIEETLRIDPNARLLEYNNICLNVKTKQGPVF